MHNTFFQKLIHRPVAVSMFFVALLIGGIFALSRLPLELAPTVEFPRLSIRASWGNTSAETVEMFLTAPIEEIVNTVYGVREVTSTSREGSANINVEFEQSVDMDFARLELNEKLAAFSENLPAGASPPRLQRYVPKDIRNLQGLLSYTLVGTRPASALRKYAEESILPVLLSVKGVANAQVFGGESYELQIEFDAEKVAAFGLNIDALTNKFREVEFSAPVGSIIIGDKKNIISARNSSIGISEIKRLVIAKSYNGSPIRIEDVGTVTIGKSESRSFYRINGKPSVTIVIDKEPGSNTLNLADNLFTKIDELSKKMPEDIGLIKETDKSEKMREELDNLYQEIIISLICIWFALVLFLRNLKAPLVILSSIFFSLAGTFLLFWLFKIGLNLFTLAGLVLGFGRLVDDSIVVLENIYRHSSDTHSVKQNFIVNAVSEIALPVIASTITTVGALLPLKFLPQDIKPYFFDFGVAVAISLMMSLLVSFTLIPTICYRFNLYSGSIKLLDRFGSFSLRIYKSFLSFALRRKKLVLIVVIYLFGLPIWLLPEKINSENIFAKAYNEIFGSEFYTDIKPYINYVFGGSSHLFFEKVNKGEEWSMGEDTYLVANVSFPQGTDIERYNDIALSIEQQVLPFGKSIKKMTTNVAGDYATVKIDISDSASTKSAPFEIKERLVLFAAQTGGASISVSGFGPGFYAGGESSPSFYVKVLGYNYTKVKEIAELFRETIEKNPRIADVDIDHSFGRWNKSYELVIVVNRDVVADKATTVADVIRAIRTFTRGSVEQSQINIDGELMPYVVKFSGYKDFSIDDLSKVVIANRNGEKIRLADLISFEERRISAEINRKNQQYTRQISFEYKGPHQFGEKFVESSIKSIPLPSGYTFDRSFDYFRFSKESEISLLWIALFGFIIVFMITSSLYESFKKPFIIILSVPFSAVGLFLSFYFLDASFGRGGYAAIILLVGIVVTNSVVLVDYLSKHVKDAKNYTSEIVEASSHRIRPVLMTTLTTIGGLLPMLIMGETTSMWYSLSLGTIGGLVSSTLLTLIVVPVVYAVFFGKRKM